MMATRLTDTELAARVRASNRQRAQRQHERRRAAGLVPLTIWLAQPTKAALTAIAAANGGAINETVEKLIAAGLNTPPATATAPTDNTELMMEIAAMLDEGLTGVDIARRLNASGRRTARGKEFIGANLLRDYRAWCEKTGTVDATKEPT